MDQKVVEIACIDCHWNQYLAVPDLVHVGFFPETCERIWIRSTKARAETDSTTNGPIPTRTSVASAMRMRRSSGPTQIILFAAVLAISACGRVGYGNVPGADDVVISPDGGVDQVFDPPAPVATDFISPDGNDGNSGSEASPWRTFSYALAQLAPGDALGVLPGRYKFDDHGLVNVKCAPEDSTCNGGPCANGTEIAPITVFSTEPRLAIIDSQGWEAPLDVDDCSNWRFLDLTLLSQDNVDSTNFNGGTAEITFSTNIHLEGNLIHGSNRYTKNHGANFYWTNGSRFVGNEVYEYHRDGLIVSGGSDMVIRQNYFNSRRTPDVSGGYTSGCSLTGDDGIEMNGAWDYVIENNVVENSCDGIEVNAEPYGPDHLPNPPPLLDNIQVLGNIVMDIDQQGIQARSNCAGQVPCPYPLASVEIRHNLAINTHTAFEDGGVEAGLWLNLTSINASERGVLLYSEDQNDALATVPSVAKTVDVGGGSYGFEVLVPNFSLSDSITFGKDLTLHPDTDVTQVTGLQVQDPGLGGCTVYVPSSSPAAALGAGATILNQYIDGVLTTAPLWNADGSFPCGAVVPGYNDVATDSCMGLHVRLNLVSACPVP
jgi:hypothetical protein